MITVSLTPQEAQRLLVFLDPVLTRWGDKESELRSARDKIDGMLFVYEENRTKAQIGATHMGMPR